MQYTCYQCLKEYKEKELREFAKIGRERKWIAKSAVCECIYYYVVCLNCYKDPFEYVIKDNEKAPALIYKGTRTCDDCRALIGPMSHR